METVIKVDNISKVYKLGTISTGTLKDDFRHFVAKARGKENEYYQGQKDTDQIWSLKNVSFEVKQGEILGIIGKNGAGKSTLLKILSRVTAPTSGEIKVKGRIASLLEVGTGFHPELTGRENIFLNGAILGMTKKEIKSKFDEMVDFSGVERFIDTPVKRYSSGMYVRLAFAVAAHLDPEILIVDEVLAVGDAEFQKKCLGKMQDVSSQGRTVLFVSHNVSVIKNLCSKGLFLEKGQVAYSGDLNKAIELYFGTKTYDSYRKTWKKNERPGNSAIKIDSVELLNEKNTVPRLINISQELHIAINYEVLKQNTLPVFSISLHNSSGDTIFGSINNVEEGYPNNRKQPGKYTVFCIIPGNFLNNGMFFVSFNGYCENFTEYFFMVAPLSFEAHDDNILAKDYKGTFGGVVRPLLKWETKTI